MQFEFDEKHELFRQEVRAFIAEHLTPELQQRTRQGGFFASNDDTKNWMKLLGTKGWAVPSWPIEHGGADWTPLQHYIFEEEHTRADAPALPFSLNHMIGPIIIKYASEELKSRMLAPMREGEISWAQGFSEPGSGSDLASLRTHAELQGDEYVVNGQKIWTSGAYESDWLFCLCKTDLTVKPQKGISFLLIPLDTPGITIRRIPQIDGDAHLCETFLDNVRVPAKNLLGEAGMGWTYAKSLLDGERTGSAYIFWSKRELAKAREIASAEMIDGVRLIDVPAYRQRFARLEAQITALEWSVLRVLADEDFKYPISTIASGLKLRGSELQQSVTMLQLDCLGTKALRYIPRENYQAVVDEADPLWPAHLLGTTPNALITRASTIYGGARQVQKNIVAKAAFGL